MSDPTADAFDLLVEPARHEYLAAEGELSRAALSPDQAGLEEARALVLRRARTAAIELHQFADRVIAEKPPWAPPGLGISALRDWVQTTHCRMLRGSPVDDVDLLHDVADALKHVTLTNPRRGRPWLVQHERAVVRLATGWGQLAYGEGKFGGVEQTIIEQLDGRQRALSSILQNVSDAWRCAIGRAFDPIG